jgi:uncharacterized protein
MNRPPLQAMLDIPWLLAACMFLGAALYSSVGHAGASAYIALMALFGVQPSVMRPTALALNIIVAGLASLRYWRARLFRWRSVWPFMLGAVPFAFLGGGIQLPSEYYRPLVGVVLLFAGIRFLFLTGLVVKREPHDPPVWLAVLLGTGIGFLSGLTGTGGGIFLSPLIVMCAWCELRTASGVAAVFILGNSVAGLAGNVVAVRALPPELPIYAVAVILGALVGTSIGTQAPPLVIQRVLGLVLIIAGAKLIGVY